jgi:hypothetical protein
MKEKTPQPCRFGETFTCFYQKKKSHPTREGELLHFSPHGPRINTVSELIYRKRPKIPLLLPEESLQTKRYTMTILAALLAIALPLADLANAERLLGGYLFQRHGGAPLKKLPPTKLTYLGYNEEYVAGTVFRDRYILSGSSNQIEGISTDVVNLAQIKASAPQDTVIQLSGQAFLQGLYRLRAQARMRRFATDLSSKPT